MVWKKISTQIRGRHNNSPKAVERRPSIAGILERLSWSMMMKIH
jgi:hypothetical protein